MIGAYWPSNGSSLSTIDYSKLNMGVIQYFLKHTVSMKDKCGRTKDFHHILCDVKWFISHPESHWFGTSAVITHAFEEGVSPTRFMPVQRIACRCAHAIMTLDLPHGNEKVFVAIPIVRNFHC